MQQTMLIDARIQLLADAALSLGHNTVVDFYSGSQEVPAKVRLLDVEELEPGQSAWAQLRLSRPAVVSRRDRFILRIPSPSMTIGGGEVIDVHPRYHRRFQQTVLNALETLERGLPEELVLAALDRRREATKQMAAAQPAGARSSRPSAQPGAKPLQGLHGYELAEIAKHSNLPVDVTQVALETLLDEGSVRKLGTMWFAQAVWEALKEESVRLVSEYHRQYPLRGGLSKEEWRTRLGLPSRMAVEIFVALQEEGQLAEVMSVSGTTSGLIRLPDFVPTFTPDQQQQVERLLHQFQQNPYTPPGRAEAEVIVGTEVLAALVEQGTLVKLGSGADAVFFLHETYDEAVARLIAYLKEQGRMTASQARDLLGTTRKYILPLLEHLDERRITRRIGDERVLATAKP